MNLGCTESNSKSNKSSLGLSKRFGFERYGFIFISRELTVVNYFINCISNREFNIGYCYIARNVISETSYHLCGN